MKKEKDELEEMIRKFRIVEGKIIFPERSEKVRQIAVDILQAVNRKHVFNKVAESVINAVIHNKELQTRTAFNM
jgi:hypothetical protein